MTNWVDQESEIVTGGAPVDESSKKQPASMSRTSKLNPKAIANARSQNQGN